MTPHWVSSQADMAGALAKMITAGNPLIKDRLIGRPNMRNIIDNMGNALTLLAQGSFKDVPLPPTIPLASSARRSLILPLARSV